MHVQLSMKSGRIILTALLFAIMFFHAWTVLAAVDDRLLTHIRKAQELCDTGYADKAIDEAKRALKIDGKCAPAYRVMAMAYMRLDSPKDRTRAEDAIRKAIELDGQNPEYHMTYVEIMMAQGFRENAKRYLEIIVKKFPDSKDAAYELGELCQAEYARLRDLVSGDQFAVANKYIVSEMANRGYDVSTARLDMEEAAPPLEFGGFAKSELEKALKMYESVNVLDPEYKELGRQRAILAYRTKDWDTLLRHAQSWLGRNPESADAWLMLGLGYHRAAEYARADSAFEGYRNLMHRYDRVHFDNFDLFLSPERQVEVQSMMAYQIDEFHKNFWKSRDPLHLTAYNERFLEHYSRVAEANVLFSSPKSREMDGWKTDRGRIWIRYGPPERIIRNLNLDAGQREIDERRQYETWDPIIEAKPLYRQDVKQKVTRTTKLQSQDEDELLEYWHYDTFTLIFYEFPLWSGNVQFANAFGINFREISRRIEKEMPDAYNMKIEGKRILFPYYAADFRGKADATRVYIFYEFPLAGIVHMQDGGNYAGKIKQGTFLMNQYWNAAYSETRELASISPIPVDTASTDRFFASNIAEVRPGSYNLSIEVMDMNSGNTGAVHAPIEIERYAYDSLEVSDLLLARDVAAREDADSVSHETLRYVPNVSGIFRKADKIFLYFEVYNLKTGGEPGATDFRVEYGLQFKKSKDEKDWNPLSYLGRLFSFSKKEYELATSMDYSGSHPVENLYLEIDPVNLKEGFYRLILSVHDRKAGKTVGKDAEFYLRE